MKRIHNKPKATRPDARANNRPILHHGTPPAKHDKKSTTPIKTPGKSQKLEAQKNSTPLSRPTHTSTEQARGKGNLDELKLCGYNACQQIYKTRAEDIVRVYLVESRLEEFSELIKSCVRRRKAYHIVTPEDMDKISGSTHHEGVCIIAKRRLPPNWELFLSILEDQGRAPQLVLILEDIGNPHNIGAIIRSAANFGCKYLLVPNEKNFKPSAALLRTAEGGGEYVEFISAPSISTIATELRLRGMPVYGTAMKGRINLYQRDESGQLPSRLAIILGNETHGISVDAKKAAVGMITIPGNGSVQSLNVGVASALIVGEYYRQHGMSPSVKPKNCV